MIRPSEKNSTPAFTPPVCRAGRQAAKARRGPNLINARARSPPRDGTAIGCSRKSAERVVD